MGDKLPVKIIVVGGLGYIGSVVCKLLIENKITPVVFDSNFYDLQQDKEYIKVDIRNKDALESAFNTYATGVNTLINLAAIVGDPACLLNTKAALDINCIGTRNIVELANKYNIKVIHASSCSLYGAEKCTLNRPLKEDSNIFPVDFYGLSKLQQEKFVSELANKHCVFRLGTAFGQSHRMRYDLVINTFSAKTAAGEPIIVFGGNQYRPFTHVLDIARAFLHAYKHNIEGIYNLGGINITIYELALLFKKKFGSKVEISKLIQDPRDYIVDNSKIKNTGFTFESDIDKDIFEMIEESKKINYKNPIFSNRDLMYLKIENLNYEKKILITGGNGTLGKACKKIMPNALFPTREELDIKHVESIKNYLSKYSVETIIHLAAMTGIPTCEQKKDEAYDTNVNGTRRLLVSAKESGVKQFIYLSTACVFPGTDEDIMYNEDSTPYPKNFYAITKLASEEITKSFNCEEFNAFIVRTNFSSMPWPYPKAFTDRFGTYLFAEDVAKGLKEICLAKPKIPVIHLCGNNKISMYEYAILGESNVEPLTLKEYNGPPLTKNMSLVSKYWNTYDIGFSKK